MRHHLVIIHLFRSCFLLKSCSTGSLFRILAVVYLQHANPFQGDETHKQEEVRSSELWAQNCLGTGDTLKYLFHERRQKSRNVK